MTCRQKNAISFIEVELGVRFDGEDDKRAASDFIGKYLLEAQIHQQDRRIKEVEELRKELGLELNHGLVHLGGCHNGFQFFENGNEACNTSCEQLRMLRRHYR